MVFQKLQAWQDKEGVTDAALAEKIGAHQTTVWRVKRGLRVLGMEQQLALQRITKISPSDWAEFFAQTVHLRPSKRTAQAQTRGGGAARKAPAKKQLRNRVVEEVA